ncbi:hypothetical protein [Streptoalloteichus hindustanus]|uniref:Secreted protein n=1 Tax=Streptoalloteichus hindustanus TaxID=2017 RepID=A0A1M5IDC0_STRHI|nr:hypothetical protein [Streptoalloteichus hindustanus]SHG26237.1 hypothetical protein SAMN05444320_107232 [Streptoalloteichus hindustanus]
MVTKKMVTVAALVVGSLVGLATAASASVSDASAQSPQVRAATDVRPAAVYGPFASFEVCWVAGNQGQQAGSWKSFFCAQNGTTSWWLFTTP